MESTATKFKKIKGFANTKGQTFETKMVALLFLRGVNSGLSFRLGSNVAGAGAMDDVVLQFKPRGQSTWVTCFVQMKHKESAWVTRRALTSGNGDFALVKYLEAYRDIKLAMSSPDKQPFFDGSMDETLLVLFTNSKASTDLGEGRQVEFGTVEEFLATNNGGVYAFDPDGNNSTDAAIFESLAKFPEERKSFLKQLRVFCGQPSENNFDALIKDELCKMDNPTIKQIDIDRLCECVVDNVSVWCEKSNDVIHGGSSFLANALDRVVVETCFAKERGTDILDVSFTDAALCPLRSVLQGDFSVLLVESSESSSCLSCTKFIQVIDGSHLFLGVRCLLDNQSAVLSEWGRGKLRYLLISAQNCIPKDMSNLMHVIRELCDKSSGTEKLKQIILLTRKNIDLENVLVKELGDQLTMFVDFFEFSQLKDVSKDKILQKGVSFQGHKTKLSNMLVDECASSQAIDAPSLKAILKSDRELSVGPVLPDEASYYVPRTLQRLHAVKRSIFSVDNLAESITIVHSSEKDIVTIFWPREALGNPQSLQKALEKLSVFPLDSKEVRTTVFVGETATIGAYVCNCLFLRSDSTDRVVALRIRPNKGPVVGWFLFLKTGTSEADAAALSEFNGSKHWLSLEEDLHWLKSNGKMEIIRAHSDETRAELFSAENVTHFSDRLVLVCAEPGMGKSTLVARLAKMTKDALPHFWVITFALNDHSQLFSQGKHNDAFAFLSEVAEIKSEFEQALFKFQLEVTGNVVVLVDGFDEIAPKYDEHCCTLITNLLKTNAMKVWVTSRNSVKSYLEDHLLTLAVKIRSFDDADQRSFLKQYWAKKSTLSEEELEGLIDLLLKNMTRAISGDFLGIPLQMRIIAEVYEENVTSLGVDSILLEKLNMLKLMEMFVDKKLQVYVHEKLNIQPSEPKYDSQFKSNKKEFIKNHSYAALTLILSEDDLKELHSKKILKKATEFFKDFASCQDNTGLIDNIDHGKPRFLHRVFAEYFVAKWFSEHLDENAVFLQTRLHLPDFSVIRTIFDLTLATDCKLHTAVLKEDLEEVKALLADGEDDIKDLGGRTALHLGAAFGPSEDQTVHARRAAIFKELITSTNNFDAEDLIYTATPLRYADMTQSWEAIDKLLPFYNNADCKRHLVVTLRNVHNRAMHLQICTHDYINLLNVCRSEGLCVDVQSPSDNARILRLIMAQNGSSQVAASFVGILPAVGDFSLHNAASRGDLDTIKAILKKAGALISDRGNRTPTSQCGSPSSTLKDIIDTGDNAGFTVLHHASFHGHGPVVDFLVDLGANIRGLDGTLGYTPLHMAAGLGRPGIVTGLLRAVKGKDRLNYLKTGNKEGRTALHLAVETGHFDIVKILVEAAEYGFQAQPSLPAGQELNDCDISDLESGRAHVSNHVDDKVDSTRVKVARPAKGEYINTKDEMGRTALHDAAWHANTVILSYLISEGGDVWRGNNNNSTPLHWAAGCGDAKTVKMLIDAVDEGRRADFVNLRDDGGNTAIHDAIWEGRWESAKFIIEAGGLVTVTNDGGKTPLMVAAEKGHREIVTKLLDGFVEREGICKKDYIYMCDKGGHNVLDLASADMVDAIKSHIAEVFDFDVD